MTNLKKLMVLVFLLLSTLVTSRIYAAVGCTLNNPDRDVRNLFPESTNYTTHFVNLQSKGGPEKKKQVEKKLGSKLDNYTEYEVDYAYYKVLKGDKPIGFIYGTNQKGKYSNMQVILATTLDGQIRDVYFQTLAAPYSSQLKNDKFIEQFKGLSLRDFYFAHEQATKYKPKTDRVNSIDTPSEEAKVDTIGTLRAIKKLLILYDFFWLNEKYNSFYNGKDAKFSKFSF